jgi:hypothetical protein
MTLQLAQSTFDVHVNSLRRCLQLKQQMIRLPKLR